MSETKIVTKQMILDARSYVPIAEKEAWIIDAASKCFDRLSISVDDEPMPEMYMVNTALKSRYLLTFLVSKYFGLEYEADPKDEALMSEAEYDSWASGHIFGEIDRWKKELDVRNKCYDLMYDFHNVEKWMTSQIMGELNVRNDFVLRQSQYMDNQVRQMPEIMEQFRSLQEARHG